ncbi:hypothetical protein RintRC_5325 [Richelia intracellularis]|nr:hypothetical protein RintRC_5325 [Richelia intracellularis]
MAFLSISGNIRTTFMAHSLAEGCATVLTEFMIARIFKLTLRAN